jgi:hypothetical protein
MAPAASVRQNLHPAHRAWCGRRRCAGALHTFRRYELELRLGKIDDTHISGD